MKSKSGGKGGKNRRRGKNFSQQKRELILREEGQEYAQVTRMLGNGRLEAQCFDGTKRMCHIRGKMRKKVWVAAGDIILVSLRDFQDAKGDVIMKYNADEARVLKTMKEIPDSAHINDDFGEAEEESNIVFGDIEGSDSDSDDDGAPKPANRGNSNSNAGMMPSLGLDSSDDSDVDVDDI